MNGAAAGSVLLLTVWTLWLFAALGVLSESPILRCAAARLPQRLRSKDWARPLPVFATTGGKDLGRAGSSRPWPAGTILDRIVSHLVVAFAAMGFVLWLATGI